MGGIFYANRYRLALQWLSIILFINLKIGNEEVDMILIRKNMYLMVAMILMVLLAGCGSSGGGKNNPQPSTTISGTAAAGAPIIGTVTVKDSSTPTAKEKTVTIAADGKYSVDVSGMTGPFMFRADGTIGGIDCHLYSAATSADVNGTINITPFTDLIVANAAGQIAKSYYDQGLFSSLTAQQLAEQAETLRTRLLPVLSALGVSGSIDLLRTAFSADRTGIDAVMDVVKVTVDPVSQVATIINIMNNQEIQDDLTRKTDTDALVINAAELTDYQQIKAQFEKFYALFKTSYPSSTHPDLLALFAADTFVESGEDLASFLPDILCSDFVGTSFSDLTIISMNEAHDHAFVSWVSSNDPQNPAGWDLVKRNGTWLFNGDQRIAEFAVRSEAVYNVNRPVQFSSGITFAFEANGNADKMVVTGPGIDTNITLTKDISSDWVQYFLEIDDVPANAIQNGAEYTIQMYLGMELKATYKKTIKKRPCNISELSTASFPAITSPTFANFYAFTGGSLTVRWTMPEGLSIHGVEVGIGVNTELYNESDDLGPGETSTVLTFPSGLSSINWRYLEVIAYDSYGRRFVTVF